MNKEWLYKVSKLIIRSTDHVTHWEAVIYIRFRFIYVLKDNISIIPILKSRKTTDYVNVMQQA